MSDPHVEYGELSDADNDISGRFTSSSTATGAFTTTVGTARGASHS